MHAPLLSNKFSLGRDRVNQVKAVIRVAERLDAKTGMAKLRSLATGRGGNGNRPALHRFKLSA